MAKRPEQGFGDFNDQLLFLEPRSLFPEGTEEGMTFDGAALPEGVSDAMPKDVIYTVAEIYPDHLVLDGNHPLAGIAIRLDITVRSVREATEEEVGSGTAGTAFFKVPPTAPGSVGAEPPETPATVAWTTPAPTMTSEPTG